MARLRPLDWSLLDGHPVLFVLVLLKALHSNPALMLLGSNAAVRMNLLLDGCSGSTPQRLAIAGVMVCGATARGASQLRQERRRQWREQGLPEPLAAISRRIGC